MAIFVIGYLLSRVEKKRAFLQNVSIFGHSWVQISYLTLGKIGCGCIAWNFDLLKPNEYSRKTNNQNNNVVTVSEWRPNVIIFRIVIHNFNLIQFFE